MALLLDGFKTVYSIQGVTAKFEEISVQPPELDAGGEISQTTMRNSRWRTSTGKQLISMGTMTSKVAYDAAVLPQMQAILGLTKLITITWPDGASVAFLGSVDKFTPDELTEGTRPEASITIIPNMRTVAGVETAPVYTSATSTTSTTATP
jgi:hypothetical protein